MPVDFAAGPASGCPFALLGSLVDRIPFGDHPRLPISAGHLRHVVIGGVRDGAKKSAGVFNCVLSRLEEFGVSCVDGVAHGYLFGQRVG